MTMSVVTFHKVLYVFAVVMIGACVAIYHGGLSSFSDVRLSGRRVPSRITIASSVATWMWAAVRDGCHRRSGPGSL